MTVTYADLESAPAVLLAGFEPEEESPIVFLRLRKAARKNGAAGEVDRAVRDPRADQDGGHSSSRRAPGGEAAALDGLADDAQLKLPGAVILVGERLADLARSVLSGKQIGGRDRCPAGVGAAAGRRTRRRGSRCAARPVARRPPARRRVGPRADRRRLERRRAADRRRPRHHSHSRGRTRAANSGALLIGGVELADLPDPDAALAAIDAAPFVVSLELRESAVTDLADVVFPVAPVVEKAGSFVNWEGRIRPFEPALQTNAVPDLRVLQFLADEIGVDLALPNAAAAGEEWPASGCGAGRGPSAPTGVAGAPVNARIRVRRCWPAGGCCSTRGGCRTANPTSQELPTRPSHGCRRPPQPRSALPKAIWSPSAPTGVRSPCRWRSPRCPTASSGCR